MMRRDSGDGCEATLQSRAPGHVAAGAVVDEQSRNCREQSRRSLTASLDGVQPNKSNRAHAGQRGQKNDACGNFR